jgi:hypothetical protein
MAKRLINIRVNPILYAKDENQQFILDSSNNKIVEKETENIVPLDDYDYKTSITDETLIARTPDIYDTTSLNPAQSSLDYRLWIPHWVGSYMWSNSNQYDFTNINYPYKAIVPSTLIPYSGSIPYNGQRYPTTGGGAPNTVYSPINTPSNPLWDTFKTRVNSIPISRRCVNGSYWFSDLNYYTKGVVDYYKQFYRDGTIWQGNTFLTPWAETNFQDSKASYQSFLNKCKTDNVIFDYFMDDREEQHFFYLDGWHNDNTSGGTPRSLGTTSCSHIITDGGTCSNGAWVSGGRIVQDARYISAIINDSRFTAKKNSKTNMTFAEEFIDHFKKLWQNHWYFKNIPLPDPFPSYTEILSPWTNITSNTNFKRTTDYWTFYNCTNQDRDVPNRVPCSGTTANCGPLGTFKSRQPANYNDINKLTGYALFHFAVPAWDATFENWMYGNYIFGQIQGSHLSDTIFKNAKHVQYRHTPISAEESSFFQQSNLEPEYRDVINGDLSGPSFYGYHGNIEYVVDYVPQIAGTPPNSKTAVQWKDNHSYRSGYVKSPQNNHEKYSWSGYGDNPYGGASCNTNNLIRYPETSMVDASNNWVPANHKKFMTELSYKVLIQEIKKLRHYVRSNPNYHQQLTPWISGPNWGSQNIYSYYNYGYWVESMFHLFLHNPVNLMHFSPFYGPTKDLQVGGNYYKLGQEEAIQFVLDEFRNMTKNLEIESCSNSTGDATKEVDRIVMEDVFEKFLISGCKIKNSKVRLWRISIPPKYFDPITGIATLTRQNKDKDVPEVIHINSNYDNLPTESWDSANIHNSRGVWITRRIEDPPPYLPNNV